MDVFHNYLFVIFDTEVFLIDLDRSTNLPEKGNSCNETVIANIERSRILLHSLNELRMQKSSMYPFPMLDVEVHLRLHLQLQQPKAITIRKVS